MKSKADEIIDYYEEYAHHKFDEKERIIINLAMIDYAKDAVQQMHNRVTKVIDGLKTTAKNETVN